MENHKNSIVEKVTRAVQDGSLPGDGCAHCGNVPAETRSLYAVCQRANRRWESRGGGFVLGRIGWLPFVLPLPPEETIEMREGKDIVVPVPLRVCDQCWQQIEGGPVVRMFSMLAQLLFLAGLVMIMAWMVSGFRGGGLSIIWTVYCFGAAAPFGLVAEFARSRWSHRIRRYLCEVHEYNQLLEAFPNAELLTRKPSALLADET